MENWSFLQHPNLSVTLVGLGISITVGYFCVKFTLSDRPPSHNSTSILVSAWMLMLTNLEFSKKICMQNRLPDSMMFPCLVCSLWQALESQKQENTGQKCRNHYMFFSFTGSLSPEAMPQSTQAACREGCNPHRSRRTVRKAGLACFLASYSPSPAHTLTPRALGSLGYSLRSCFPLFWE